MAEPYISLDGVTSITKGLRLIEAVPFIIPRRTYAKEYIPGRLGCIRSTLPTYGPSGWKLTVSRTGAVDKSSVINDLQLLAPWFLNSTKLKVWNDTTKYYIGNIEGDADFSMLSRKHGQLKVDFICNPPCYHKCRSIQAGWEPVAGLVADQIADTNETCSATLSATGALPSVAYAAAHPAALYFKITGTWTALTIGGATGLILNWAAGSSTTIYIDCESQQVYYYSGGVLTSLTGYISGDFPALTTTAAIAVTGTAFSIVIRMLAIERG